MPLDTETNKLQNRYLGFWNFENFGNLEIFSTFFLFLQKNPPKFQKFKKTEYMY